MAYTKDKTRFHHKKYGVGTFRGYNDTGNMLIDFADLGVKVFAESSIQSGHLTLVGEIFQTPPQTPPMTPVIPNGSPRQYDTSNTIVGDRNILEAFKCEDIVFFNESYLVIGTETQACVIRAAYDLTIIGNLSASEIQINGTLTVIGNIVAEKINCSNSLVCQGSLTADTIYVGADLIADSVKCTEFLCDGNAVIRTTIDIDKSARIEKTVVACEGIVGGGMFAATHAIANEYFEFDGDVEGNIMELETATTISEISLPMSTTADSFERPIDEVLTKIAERLRSEYGRIKELDEHALLELTQKLSSSGLGELDDMSNLFEQLTQISHKDEINDLGDYLVIEYAKKKLPSEVYCYESIKLIDSTLLPKATANLEDLEFIPSSVDKIAQALRIIMQLKDDLPLSVDTLCDKVFSSIGLRFSTVKTIISRIGSQFTPITVPQTTENSTAVTTLPNFIHTDKDDCRPNPVMTACASQVDFLEKSLFVVGRFFTMSNDEIIRLGSAKIHTVSDFLSVNPEYIQTLYKKKPFLAHHLITVWKKMKAAKEHTI